PIVDRDGLQMLPRGQPAPLCVRMAHATTGISTDSLVRIQLPVAHRQRRVRGRQPFPGPRVLPCPRAGIVYHAEVCLWPLRSQAPPELFSQLVACPVTTAVE